jgi:hypothetical protein
MLSLHIHYFFNFYYFNNLRLLLLYHHKFSTSAHLVIISLKRRETVCSIVLLVRAAGEHIVFLFRVCPEFLRISIILTFSIRLVVGSPELLIISIEVSMVFNILRETLVISNSLFLSTSLVQFVVIQFLSSLLVYSIKIAIISFKSILSILRNLLKPIISIIAKCLLGSHLLNRFLKVDSLLTSLVLFLSFTIDIILVHQVSMTRHFIVGIQRI